MFLEPSLRLRIAIGLVAFSLATSIGFGFGAYWAADKMEVLVLERTIASVGQRIRAAIAAGETPQLPEQDWFYARFASDGDIESGFSQLQNGSHHDVIVDRREYHLWIGTVPGDRLFIIFDLAQIEIYEAQLRIFLVSIGAVLAVLAMGLGLWLTAWVARPVTALAERVANLPRDAERLSLPSGEDPDLAVLAGAIDAYLKDNRKLVERERAFTGMASHELRNPVATISAALDVIALHGNESGLAEPLDRIRRATHRMTGLIDVLLDLARQQKRNGSEDTECRPAELIREIVDQEIERLAGNQRRVEFELDDELVLQTRPAMFQVIASNLISNALTHGSGPIIWIRLDRDEFVVRSEGAADTMPDSGRLGLTIVDAICSRCGWTFNYMVEGQQTTASVRWG